MTMKKLLRGVQVTFGLEKGALSANKQQLRDVIKAELEELARGGGMRGTGEVSTPAGTPAGSAAAGAHGLRPALLSASASSALPCEARRP